MSLRLCLADPFRQWRHGTFVPLWVDMCWSAGGKLIVRNLRALLDGCASCLARSPVEAVPAYPGHPFRHRGRHTPCLPYRRRRLRLHHPHRRHQSSIFALRNHQDLCCAGPAHRLWRSDVRTWGRYVVAHQCEASCVASSHVVSENELDMFDIRRASLGYGLTGDFLGCDDE